jgi:hypothetical protein
MRQLAALLRVWWLNRGRALWIIDENRRYQILDAAGPDFVITAGWDGKLEKRCSECDAEESPSSPPYIDHLPFCPGEARYKAVCRLIPREHAV